MRRRDQAFLAGALEVLETPPAPLAATTILVICLFASAALAWSWFGRLDVIAVAQGKLQPSGRVKTVQSLETGRVILDRVTNGATVQAGEVLVELDPQGAEADEGAIAAELDGYRAEVVRRAAAIACIRAGRIDIRNAGQLDRAVKWPPAISPVVRQREEGVLAADITRLAAELAVLDAQRRQKEAEKSKLNATIEAQNALITTLNERVTMREDLKNTTAFSRSGVLDATEMLRVQQATLAQEEGQLGEIDASLSVNARDSLKTTQAFIAENAQKLGEAERQVAVLTKKLESAETRLRNLMVRAPVAGVVQASALTTVGQVVSPGQELMRIVPQGAALEVAAYLPNSDIGFVQRGQRAVVKIASFPFTRYGTVDAIVTSVARDAIPEPDAAALEGDPARARRADMPAGADRVQNLVFPITLRLLTRTVTVDGTEVPLGAGMEVTVEIRTGTRRIIEYLFSPLLQTGSEAMRER